MTFGIGIDIVDIKRFTDYSDKSDIHLSKWFTVDELDYCFGKKISKNSLAGKFAAKEAVIKVLSDQGINISHLNQIEILNDESGKPFVSSSPIKGINNTIRISISHDGGFAIAVAILE